MRSRALVVLLAAVTAAGCGAARHAAPATTTNTTTKTSHPVAGCKLNAGQRRAVRLALRDIRKLRQIQAPLHRFTERGTPAQEAETGRFLADMTSAKKLPVNVRAHLLHVAKNATGLCGLCFQGLEAEEPVLATRTGESRCG
jgi:uncharacterized membrane protein